MFSKQAKRLLVALIRPVNYFEEKQIARRDFLKRTGGTIIGGSLVASLLEEEAKAEILATNPNGFLNIENYVDSTIGVDSLRPIHYDDPGISDGYNAGWDSSLINPPPGRCAIYSDISDIEPTNNKLVKDYRLPSSTLDFNIKLVYKGVLSEAKNNYIQFSLPYGAEWEFGDKDILFQSDLLPYGTVVDVRRAIAENGGIVPLIDLPAGTYDPNTPYGEGTLTVGTRILSDLVNEVGTVNFQDFAELAKDWKKPQGQYVGDITGPNGIPDGYVDQLDLSVFSSEWLKTI